MSTIKYWEDSIMKKRKLTIIGVIVAVLLIGRFSLISYASGAEKVDPERTAWLCSALIAHRGLHDNDGGIPENSILAFEKAIEKGYIIELDVSMTKDKKLVVFHDKKLKRVFGVDNYLNELTYEEVSKYKLFNTDETIPLFSEVLKFVAGRVPLLIEIKNEGEVGEMESMIYSELKDYHGQYAIQAFNPYTLKWFRINAPDVLRGQLSGSFTVSDYDAEYAGTTRLPWYKKILLRNMLLNFESRPNFISYEVNNTSDSRLKSLKKLGVPILGWTVKDKETFEIAKKKFDNLIIEY